MKRLMVLPLVVLIIALAWPAEAQRFRGSYPGGHYGRGRPGFGPSRSCGVRPPGIGHYRPSPQHGFRPPGPSSHYGYRRPSTLHRPGGYPRYPGYSGGYGGYSRSGYGYRRSGFRGYPGGYPKAGRYGGYGNYGGSCGSSYGRFPIGGHFGYPVGGFSPTISDFDDDSRVTNLSLDLTNLFGGLMGGQQMPIYAPLDEPPIDYEEPYDFYQPVEAIPPVRSCRDAPREPMVIEREMPAPAVAPTVININIMDKPVKPEPRKVCAPRPPVSPVEIHVPRKKECDKPAETDILIVPPTDCQ